MSTEPTSEGSVPTPHVLGAAIKAATVIDPDGTPVAAARESYLRLPTGGLYRFHDLVLGELLLTESGLVGQDDETLHSTEALRRVLALGDDDARKVLLALLLERHPPLWLHSATASDSLLPEFIPDRDAALLDENIPDLGELEAVLFALSSGYDPEARARLGAMGEEHVVSVSRNELEERGRRDLAAQVQRVSLISDHLGYDVLAPTLSGGSRRLEVKTTGRTSQTIAVVISRNQVEVGLRDSSWALVICRVDARDTVCVVGWCRGSALASYLPEDAHPRGRWASVRLSIAEDVLSLGLPPCD